MHSIIGDITNGYFEHYDVWVRDKKKHFIAYVTAFLSETHGKNIERIAEKAVEVSYDNMHLVAESPWAHYDMNESRIRFIKETARCLPCEKAALIPDDTGVPKRGTATDKPLASKGIVPSFSDYPANE